MDSRRFNTALRQARKARFPKREYRGGTARLVNRMAVHVSPVERAALEKLCEDEGISMNLAVRAILRMVLDVED